MQGCGVSAGYYADVPGHACVCTVLASSLPGLWAWIGHRTDPPEPQPLPTVLLAEGCGVWKMAEELLLREQGTWRVTAPQRKPRWPQRSSGLPEPGAHVPGRERNRSPKQGLSPHSSRPRDHTLHKLRVRGSAQEGPPG